MVMVLATSESLKMALTLMAVTVTMMVMALRTLLIQMMTMTVWRIAVMRFHTMPVRLSIRTRMGLATTVTRMMITTG